MGVGIPPGKDAPQAADFLHDWEFNALRLLAHPDRARMLRAMTGQAMSVQELSQTLGLNPGSVFRDLNNMKTWASWPRKSSPTEFTTEQTPLLWSASPSTWSVT